MDYVEEFLSLDEQENKKFKPERKPCIGCCFFHLHAMQYHKIQVPYGICEITLKNIPESDFYKSQKTCKDRKKREAKR